MANHSQEAFVATTLRGLGEIPDIIQSVVGSNKPDGDDADPRSVVFYTLRPMSGNTMMDSAHFSTILAYLTNTNESTTLIVEPTYEGHMDHPVMLATGEIYAMQPVSTEVFLEADRFKAWKLVPRQDPPTFESLNNFPSLKVIAVNGFEDSFTRSGRKEVERVLSRIDQVHIAGIRLELAEDPPTGASDDIYVKKNEEIDDPRNGAYGNRIASKNDPYQRCTTCRLGRDVCTGHQRYFKLKRPVFAPMIHSATYTGPLPGRARDKRTYASILLHPFCWHKWANLYISDDSVRRFFPIPPLHIMDSHTPNRPPMHIYTGHKCNACAKNVRINRVTANTEQEYVPNSEERSEFAIVIKRQTTAVGGKHKRVVVTAPMLQAILTLVEKAHPHLMAKLGIDLKRLIQTTVAALPPEEYKVPLNEFQSAARSLKPSMTALIRATDPLRSSTLLQAAITGETGVSKRAKGKEGVFAGFRIALSTASRTILAVWGGRAGDVAFSSIVNHIVVVKSPEYKEYKDLLARNSIARITDRHGAHHNSEELMVYPDDPEPLEVLKLMPAVNVDLRDLLDEELPEDTLYHVHRTATLPSKPTGITVRVYIPPQVSFEDIESISRRFDSGDRIIISRNPVISKGGIYSANVVKLKGGHVTCSSPAGDKLLKGDHDGDAVPATILPDQENAEVVHRTFSMPSLTSFDSRSGATAPANHQDPAVVLGLISAVCSAKERVYFRVPPEWLTQQPYEFLYNAPNSTRFYIDSSKFRPFLPPGGIAYDDFAPQRGRPEAQPTESPSTLWVSAQDLMRILLPVDMPPYTYREGTKLEYVNLATRDVCSKMLAKNAIGPHPGSLMHHIYRLGTAVDYLNLISWQTGLTGQISANNTAIMWISVFDMIPKYTEPVDLAAMHADYMATPGLMEWQRAALEWEYQRWHNPEGLTGQRYAIEYERRAMFIATDMTNEEIASQTSIAPAMVGPIANMVMPKARGSEGGLRSALSCFGTLSHNVPPFVVPTKTPNIDTNSRSTYSVASNPTLHGLIVGTLAHGIDTMDMFYVILAAVTSQLSTPHTTKVKGESSKYHTANTSNVYIKNKVARTPGLNIGTYPNA